MRDPADLGERFMALHHRDRPLLLPNPWDAGTARLLAAMGFEALGTTSLGLANGLGVSRASREAILDNGAAIVAATRLPVTIDLENGFGDDPDSVADAIEQAARLGAAGASIEDFTGDPDRPIYAFDLAVERIAAAVEAARRRPSPFVVTARAENHLHGIRDLDDTIRRLQAFEAAGAHVLYAPGLRRLDEIEQVVRSVSRPVNVVMGFADPSITLDQLAAVGVKRVSIGGALSRVALGAFRKAAGEMRAGRFQFVADLVPIADLWSAFDEG